ncbi:MAG: hypothetical protein IJ179_02425 [Oscillospiraceae bacterium]|nr:hypothetical protein [Oscillospiraceae bacterium]
MSRIRIERTTAALCGVMLTGAWMATCGAGTACAEGLLAARLEERLDMSQEEVQAWQEVKEQVREDIQTRHEERREEIREDLRSDLESALDRYESQRGTEEAQPESGTLPDFEAEPTGEEQAAPAISLPDQETLEQARQAYEDLAAKAVEHVAERAAQDSSETERQESSPVKGLLGDLLGLDLDVDLNADDFLTDDTINHDISIPVENEMQDRSNNRLSIIHDHSRTFNVDRSREYNSVNYEYTVTQTPAQARPTAVSGKSGYSAVADPSWYQFRRADSGSVYTGDAGSIWPWVLGTLVGGGGLAALPGLRKKLQ